MGRLRPDGGVGRAGSRVSSAAQAQCAGSCVRRLVCGSGAHGGYVCADDPNASLQLPLDWQWRWQAATEQYNALGEAALAAVGRSRLWLDGQAMVDLFKAHASDRGLRSDPFFDDGQTPAGAPCLVAGHAFTARPWRWHYLEMIHGECEDIGEHAVQAPAPAD